jgi:hypothetical protein
LTHSCCARQQILYPTEATEAAQLRSHGARFVAKSPQTSAHLPEGGQRRRKHAHATIFLANESQLGSIRALDSAMSSLRTTSQADATRPITENRRLRSPHVALIVDWLPVSGNATR